LRNAPPRRLRETRPGRARPKPWIICDYIGRLALVTVIVALGT
jgi:hypothetical protein